MFAALLFAATCGTMTPGNVLLGYASRHNGLCSAIMSCDIGSDIDFIAVGNGYDFNCAPHTFVWNFHDRTPNQIETGPAVRHSYPFGYSGDVTLTITNPQQTLVLSEPINVQVPPAGWDRWTGLWVTTYDNVVYCEVNWSSSLPPFELDFGDGTIVKGSQPPTTLNSPVVFHVYTKPGVYKILVRNGPLSPASGFTLDDVWSAQVVIRSVPRSRGVRH